MEKKITRRDLFRYTALAGTGILSIPYSFASSTPENAGSKEKINMPERILGRTGMRLPILSMGVNRSDNKNVLRTAFNAGIVHFDTGYVYQNGNSEILMGEVFRNHPRESINIGTKSKYDYPLSDNFEEQMMESLDISLKRMKIDYVDIFYAHDISTVEKLTDPRVLALLKNIKESGKARFIGFSSHDQNNDLLHAAVETDVYDVAMITYNFRIKNIQETNAAIEKAARAGLGIIAMKVIAGGTEDADGKKKMDGKPCLRWIWNNKNITTVVPSIANYDELDNCLEAVQAPEVTPVDKEYLAGLKNRDSMFCQQCDSCRDQCPKGLPIPDMMRAYMYAYGYKYATLSKETLLEAGIPADPCSGCKECLVKCPSGFRVDKKIASIRPLINIPDVFLT